MSKEIESDVHPDVEQYLLKHGTRYTPIVPPEDVIRGKLGTCFDTSILNAIVGGKYRYVEGMAFSRTMGVWCLHAWLTDGEHAIDPTWRAYDNGEEMPMPTVYIGIELETKAVAKFMLATEYQGVIANAWRSVKVAMHALPKDFPIIKTIWRERNIPSTSRAR
jgi:hypothetical protein